MKTDFYFQLKFGDAEKYLAKMSAMHIMAALMLLVYLFFLTPEWDSRWTEIISIGPALLAIIYFAIFKKDMLRQEGVNRIFRLLEMGLLFIAGYYFYSESQSWAAILYITVAVGMLFLLMLEHKIFGGQFIEMKEQRIHIPKLLGSDEILWNDLERVVLKHNVITFQKKDGQFIQKNVHHLYDDAELSQFYNFCEYKLNR